MQEALLMLSKMFGESQKASPIAAGFLCSMCFTLTLAAQVLFSAFQRGSAVEGNTPQLLRELLFGSMPSCRCFRGMCIAWQHSLGLRYSILTFLRTRASNSGTKTSASVWHQYLSRFTASASCVVLNPRQFSARWSGARKLCFNVWAIFSP